MTITLTDPANDTACMRRGSCNVNPNPYRTTDHEGDSDE